MEKERNKGYLWLPWAIALYPLALDVLAFRLTGATPGEGLWPLAVPAPAAFLLLRCVLWLLLSFSAGEVFRSGTLSGGETLKLFAAQPVAFFLWNVFFYYFHETALSFFWLLFLLLVALRTLADAEHCAPGSGKRQFPWIVYLAALLLLHLRLLLWG